MQQYCDDWQPACGNGRISGTSRSLSVQALQNILRNGLIGCNERRRKDRYFQSHIEEDEKFIPEGIEGRVPYKGHLSESIYQFVGGLRAGMGYTGSAIIVELRTEARFVKITAVGLRESHDTIFLLPKKLRIIQ